MARSATWSGHTVDRTESIPPDARVRHVDQLTEAARSYVVACAATEGDPPPEPLPADLRAGDVVVYTDYLLIG